MAETKTEATGRSAYVFFDIENPLVAWLVYRGQITSVARVLPGALSIWHTERLRSSLDNPQPYWTERAIEHVRRMSFADSVSRLNGFYAFPDEETACRAAQSWDGRVFRRARLSKIAISPGSRISQYDSEWISRDFEGGPDSWISQYLSGRPRGTSPTYELLVDGTATVLSTDLRASAREVVSRTWPEAMRFLEFARLGAELNSDMGVIVALAMNDGHKLEIKYYLNMVDADNPDFLERLRQYDGPVDHEALNTGVRVPDLTSHFFEFRL